MNNNLKKNLTDAICQKKASVLVTMHWIIYTIMFYSFKNILFFNNGITYSLKAPKPSVTVYTSFKRNSTFKMISHSNEKT